MTDRQPQPSGFLNNDGTAQQYEGINQNPLYASEYYSEGSSQPDRWFAIDWGIWNLSGTSSHN